MARSATRSVRNRTVSRRGNAETLRRYWAEGKGALKIRWGSPGDFSRCTRQLVKYMPGREKGYCNLLHHRALGIYPATHAKALGGGHGGGTRRAARRLAH